MSLSRPGAHALLRSSLLAPFQVRSFRFQYPADLLTSWGGEMENLILGWYILVATGSVLLLTLFGSLQYFGTLVAPLLGLAGDRLGHRNVLCAMRAVYATLAALVATLAFSGWLNPADVFVLAAIGGLVRPADLAMRSALVAETIPSDRLIGAMGASRTTADSARIAGSLAGAGLFAAFGMGPAYLGITLVYITGFLLTLGTGAPRRYVEVLPRFAFWRDLREGLTYVWDAPSSLAALLLAFLVNMTAFPLTSGLLPYVAREIYHIDQTGLGTLVASFAGGSLIGSITISMAGRLIRPARMMLVFAIAWYAMLLVFAHMPDAPHGRAVLLLAGLAQSLSLVPMSVMLLQGAGERFRGRVMGLRMLAIYGLPIGLMATGALIGRCGFTAATTLLCSTGLLLTLVIAVHWRADLWPREAPANGR
ncbi:MAG: MFS transporter [Acetobacteraceae bacterium]|jgi:Na+/melibiose symporter-like transporter